MKPEEALETMKLMGTPVSRETWRRWVNAGLIPAPIRGNLGRAGGRFSNYPIEAPWEAFAAWHLLKKHSIKRVVEIRQEALYYLPAICFWEMEVLRDLAEAWVENHKGLKSEHNFASDVSLSDTVERIVDTDVFQWLMLRIKAEYGIPNTVPISVNISYYGSWDEKEWQEQVAENYSEKFPNMTEHEGKIFYIDWQIDRVTRYEEGKLGDFILDGKLESSEKDRIEYFIKETPDGEITIKDETTRGNGFRLILRTVNAMVRHYKPRYKTRE